MVGEDPGHQSLLLDYVLGQPVTLEKMLLPLQFRVRSELGELIYKAQDLHLEGAILVYNPVKDELDWIPIEECMNNLWQVEIASAKELSGLVLQPSEWKMCRAPQVGRGKEEGMESGLTYETDDGPDGWESPTDSRDSHSTSSVSTSKEELGMDRWEVGSESSHEEEITKEPMEEKASSDAESKGSAMTDTLWAVSHPPVKRLGGLKTPWIWATQLGVMAGQNRLL